MMNTFINRNNELMLIDNAINTLLERKRLPQTPLIAFYGVAGIGKTTLLRKVEERCVAKSLSCIWVDGAETFSFQFLESTKELLKEKKPVVVIVDSLEAVGEEHLRGIEAELRNLIENSNLLTVFASTNLQIFYNAPWIKRNLTTFPLSPFDQKSCTKYLDMNHYYFSPRIRDIIYEWTRGYPLAMNIMIEAILKESLDPEWEPDRKMLLSILTEKVLYRKLFSKTNVSNFVYLSTLLPLLAMPRYFNFEITQAIIDQFAPPECSLNSYLAFKRLVSVINEISGVLNWNPVAGYSIDTVVRTFFLNQLRIEKPQRYFAIHSFLAEINYRSAQGVAGPDRVRSLREFFYHLALSGEAAEVTRNLIKYLGQLIHAEPLDHFLQFYEEFLQDEDLKAALGVNTHDIIAFINQSLQTR